MLCMDVRIDGDPVMDIEEEFLKLKLEDTPLVRKLINVIDKGTYYNETSFLDRFGLKSSIDFLSTGCKAALLVALVPNLLVDLRECGYNARDAIIHHCTNGKVVMDFPLITIAYDRTDDSCDVAVNGYRITTVSRLNTYLCDEWPDPPDLADPGITKL